MIRMEPHFMNEQDMQKRIDELEVQNERLSKQILSLLNSKEQSAPEQIDPIFSLDFQNKLIAFIHTVSSNPDVERIYDFLVREMSKALDADSVIVLLEGGSDQRSLVVTNQYCEQSQQQIPLPFFISMSEEDAFRKYILNCIDTKDLQRGQWFESVEVHPNIYIREAMAKSIEIHDQGNVVFCVMWNEDLNHPPGMEVLFESIIRYTAVVLEQSHLLTHIQDLKEQQESLIESMPSAIIGLDFLGSITLWNGKAKSFFGIGEEEALGMNFGKLIPEFNFVIDALMDVVYTQQEEIVFNHVVFKDVKGKTRYLQPHLYNMLNADRGEIAVRIDDITQQINLQQQLIHAQKMETLGEISGGLAHDFNNALGGVVGTLSLLKKRWKDMEHQNTTDWADIDIIEDCSKRASEIVKKLLDLSRKTEVRMGRVNLCESLDSVWKIVKGTFGKDIQIRYERHCNQAWTLGENGQIENGILNLCLNAKDAMPEGGTLDIILSEFNTEREFCIKHGGEEGKKFYRIDVADTGNGLTQDELKKIFNAFYTTKAPGEGTGLGLSILDKMMQDHHGFVEVESFVGTGTLFSLFFPGVEGESVPVDFEDLPSVISKRTKQALVVDDEKVIRHVLTRMFEDLRYNVDEAVSGLDAIRLLGENKRYDVIVLDVDMPGMNGFEVFNMFRNKYPNQKIIFCTGRKEKYDFTEVEKSGNVMIMAKPFEIEELAEVIKEIS